jgi:hypothetical protein
LAAGFENVRAEAKKAGRNPDEIELACCLPVELTPTAGPQIEIISEAASNKSWKD